MSETLNKKKILVVDDTEATRYAISRTLAKDGYEIVEAANGRDALRLVQSEQPDLVTLDIHLPDILGFEVCRQIKANPATAHIPVLQVSASYITSKDRIHGLEGGADSYLTHPFEPPVLIATVRALLRSRELHEELRLTEERFRVALKNAPIMIYTCDANGVYTWVYNAHAPYASEAFIGKTDYDILLPADAKKLMDLKQETLSNGVGQRHVVDLTIADGQLRWYDITLEPLSNSAGLQEGLTVACIDITERMRAEREQREATLEAELANEAKSRFLSNMSHEIRTPLGVIQGFADLALRPSLSEKELHEYLFTIRRNAQNLTQLIGDILDLSKIEAGKIEIERRAFSLNELLQDIMASLGLTAQEKGLRLELTVDADTPAFIVSDSVRVRQVLINLLSNAIKFTDSGAVKLKVAAVPQKDQRVEIRINVEDSGIGITAEQRDRLFNSFTQADSSTTRKFGGTGLGLSLSRRLSQLLDGDVKLVRSEQGRGSEFLFRFKATVAPSAGLSGPQIPHDKPVLALKGLNILLVEDSADNQMLFSHYLQSTGAHFTVASDGLEALEAWPTQNFDAILMDLQMPNMDGYTALARLKESGMNRPVIALTAHALSEERDRALRAGFAGYLTKPLDPKQLVRTLTELTRS